MGKETLEEGFKRIYESMDFTEFCFPSFKLGTEWKQEQDKNKYGEEELKKLMFDFYYDMSHKMNVPENLISENMTNVDVWLENFKNKK